MVRHRPGQIASPLYHQIESPAEKPGGAADQRRDHHVKGGRRQPDEQRQAGAVDQAAQEVAAKLVGADEGAERTQRVLSDQSHGPHGYA